MATEVGQEAGSFPCRVRQTAAILTHAGGGPGTVMSGVALCREQAGRLYETCSNPSSRSIPSNAAKTKPHPP
jgi:hypothetical protein